MIESQNYIAIPAGSTIKEQLNIREISPLEFSERVELSEEFVLGLLEGQVELTPDIALKLESLFGVPSSFWNKLESEYREQLILIAEEDK